ncbi:MAG TPA: ABC transporter substrate-binding protein, partial [Ktedonobacteraceae bacterium]|nr:ABC transporter substrate-binding protein [Ktedonobacteraceae bacterium]
LGSNKEQAVREVAQRFAALGQYPGFPGVVDMFKEREAYYIVLQYVEGKRLSALLEEHGGVLPEHIAVQYALQLSEMLRLLSSQKTPIVHGAISPSTVLVDPQGTQVYLNLLPPFTPTDTTDLKSTAGYIAPEQLEGKVTLLSDIYGVSATLHHSATGYDPSGRMAFFYPPARQVNPLASSRLEHILTKGLHLNPAQRYQKPEQLRDALNRLLGTYPVTEKLTSRVDDVIQTSTFRRRVQRRRSFAVSLFAVIAMLVVLFLAGGILLAILHSPAVAIVDPEANARATAQAKAFATVTATKLTKRNLEISNELPSYTQRGIGLSDGNLTFDKSNPKPTITKADGALCANNVDCKEQAAAQLQAGNIFVASSYLNAAVDANPTDAEALIYKENLNIVRYQLNSITVVVATNLSPTSDLDVARARLRSIYLAQFEINKLNILPNGYQLRVLLANVGSNSQDVQTLTKFINARVVGSSGNVDQIVSVIGWPNSAQTLQAHAALAKINVPFISPDVASPDATSDEYFYHLNPDYDTQGAALAKIAAQKLQAKNVMVVHDPNDPQSVALASSIAKQVGQLGGKVVGTNQDTFSEKVTTSDGYQQGIVPAARAANADVVIIAGTDSDAITLTQAIDAAAQKQPGDGVLQNLQVLAGNATGMLQVLQRDDVLGSTNFSARSLQRLSFVALGDLDANTILKQAPNTLQSYFATDWAGTFQNSIDPTNNSPAFDQNAMLTYDAMWIVGRAMSQVKGTLDNAALQNVLRTNIGQNNAFMLEGTTGRIVFDQQGGPIDKAIYWESVAKDGTIQLNGVFGTYQ